MINVWLLILAVGVGIALGLLGGGGSILTIPLLTYVGGVAPKVAIASSLLVVAVTSTVGAASHARAGRVRWRTGVVFGGGGVFGAHAGGRVAHYLSAEFLMILFALIMTVSAAAMIWRRPPLPRAPSDHLSSLLFVEGIGIGLVTGLVGAGGGFVIVPALVFLGRLPMKEAVGTSLVVIAMNGFAGLSGHLGHVTMDWPLAASVSAAAVTGSLIGARLVDRVPQEPLRRAFGGLVLAMALFILIKQVS